MCISSVVWRSRNHGITLKLNNSVNTAADADDDKTFGKFTEKVVIHFKKSWLFYDYEFTFHVPPSPPPLRLNPPM